MIAEDLMPQLTTARGGTDYFSTNKETKMSLLSRILKLLKLTRIQSTTLALTVQPAASNGRWEQVRLAGSEIVHSYRYTCRCGQTQPLTIAEAKDGKIRKCGCGKPYSLLRDLALAADSTITEYEYALTTLPVHALAVQQPRRPAAQVVDWGYETAGEVTWTGAPPSDVQYR